MEERSCIGLRSMAVTRFFVACSKLVPTRTKPTMMEGRLCIELHAMAIEVIVCWLLKAGADKDKADNDGSTPMHRAAQYGHHHILRSLLEAGAGKEKADNDGRTPVHWAACKGHSEILRCLLELLRNVAAIRDCALPDVAC